MKARLREIVSVLAILVYAFLAFGSGESTNAPGTKQVAPAETPRTHQVEYRVYGGEFDLTYANSQGNTEQIAGHRGTWTYTFATSEWRFFAYVSAQNKWTFGTIDVEIWIDGQKAQSASSSGAYVIATASCSVP